MENKIIGAYARTHVTAYRPKLKKGGMTRGPDDAAHGKGGRILSPNQQTAGAKDDPVR